MSNSNTHHCITNVIVIVIKQGDKFLLTRRKQDDEYGGRYDGFWQLAGGGLEFGETVEECAVREAKEELGVSVEVIAQLPKSYTRVIQNTWHGLILPILCKFTEENPQIVLNEEASEYGWFTLEEVKKLTTMPFDGDILKLVKLSISSTT